MTTSITSTNITSPPTLEISRNEDNEKSSIIIETLNEAAHFEGASQIEHEFFGSTGKGFCFGMCPYSWCLPPKKEFEDFYKNNPDRCSTYGVAIRKESNDHRIIGVITLRQGGQTSTFDESMIHKPTKDEMYVDHIAVTKEARGMGVGTALLEWSEVKARERNAKKLSLGVVKGNPAKRLYSRFGFEDVGTDMCCTFFILGRPHGIIGSDFMVKKLL